MTHSHTVSRDPQTCLQWLIHLRWIAVASQLATCAFVSGVMQVSLPIALLAACLLVTIGSNLILVLLPSLRKTKARRILPLLIFGDALILTAMLYLTGGAHNPFTLLYLIHITLALSLLSTRAGWLMVGLTAGGFAALFSSPFMLMAADGTSVCSDMQTHLVGMLVALVATGAGTVYFVHWLNRTIDEQDRALQATRDLAHQQERFASLATLAAGVAHELSTPLATIAVAASELEDELKTRRAHADECDDASLICQQVERCRSIIESLRSQVNDAAAPPVSPVHLPQLPHLLRDYLAPELASRLHFTSPPPEASVELSLPRLLQAIGILIQNAADAAPSGSPIRMFLAEKDSVLTIQIADDGRGMEPNLVKRLGEPFITTKSQQGGMGLGLFLVKRFLLAFNGDWKIDSSPGEGTSFTLHLPVSQPATQAS